MRSKYYTCAAAAIVSAASLLVLQIIGGLEYTAGASLYTQASMVTAMVAVAVLPLFVHAAWHTKSRAISAVLFAGFVALLAYSLPANIGRIGEVKEVKVAAAVDAVSIKAQIADLEKTLRFAEPAMASECKGAPDPTPASWPECRRKQGSVEAFRKQRADLQRSLAAIGKDQFGDQGSETLAWALGSVGVTATMIRRASGMAFAIGLELSIFALVWFAAALIGKGKSKSAPLSINTEEVEAVPATPSGGHKRPITKAEALSDLQTLLRIGQSVPSQDWLKDRWGLASKGTPSKWLSEWEEAGEIPSRMRVGKCNTLEAA